ncbi:MAG: hypothetical protein IIX01_00850 [Clostridia bacterium]|nr:hypothetical protein [Clostridia bacterium]
MRSKRAARYYLAVIGLLIFLFFTNDFGLIDIQKTAIVTAVGIDREDEQFVLTTQIAVPQASKQGEQVQSVEIESKGKTVAEAFEQVNAKTGWYPKLVFCDLIVLGKETAEKNVFEALDFFLRNEYVSDNCNVCVYEKKAKEVLSAKTPIEKISSMAVDKILSTHAAKVGSVLPVSLKDFAKSYFSAGRSGYLPVLKVQSPGGESPSQSTAPPTADNSEQNSEQNSGQNSGGQNSGQGGQGASEKIFSAEETALFVGGIMLGKLDQEETFALSSVKERLRLASYSLESSGSDYTLVFKNNQPKIKFFIDKNATARLDISLKLTAGIQDVSTPNTATEIATPSTIPEGLFKDASEKIKQSIERVFLKTVAINCDVFDLYEKLRKFERKYYPAYQDDLLSRVTLKVKVELQNAR